MNEYLSGKCAHCGRKKEEHGESIFCRDEDGCIDYLEGTTFFDSGLKLLHDRAPELLQAARALVEHKRMNLTHFTESRLYAWENELHNLIDELESIVGDILRPQP